MTKKRPRKARIKDPLARNKPLPRFGATKAQGRRLQRERDDKNKIHQLEQEVESLRLALDNYKGRECEYMRRILARTPTDAQIGALVEISRLPVADVEDLGIVKQVLVIVEWLKALRDRPVEKASWRAMMDTVASGKPVGLVDECPSSAAAMKERVF